MPAKITLKVAKGADAGKSYSYDGKEILIVGRQADCSIKIPDSAVTVSRYHCLIDISPPSVMVRDFGSLNGTYLNGKKIGQREAGAPIASGMDAVGSRGEEFPMKPGDRLGLGKDFELTLEIKLPQYCADCLNEMWDSKHKDSEGLAICPDCQERQQAEKRKNQEIAAKAEKERIEAQKIADQEKKRREDERKAKELKRLAGRRCEVCGGSVPGGDDAPGICEKCQGDPMKVLMHLMNMARQGHGDAVHISGYRNIKLLGEGGMGQVWLVEEEATGQQMALKLMLPKASADTNCRNMFIREAMLATQLKHDNIVRHHKFGQAGDTYFILMELCEEGSVDKLIERNGGKLNIDLATKITLQVLDGLNYAHNATVIAQLKKEKVQTSGIIHRDFKPANIFLRGSGKNLSAKIADFGLAKTFETAGLSGHTSTGGLAGTPVFMPRQQIIDFKYSKPDVDVWAVAASYYFMLTGQYPKSFTKGKNPFSVALNERAIPICERNPAVPQRLAEVINTALIETPGIGFKSAADFKKSMEGAL